MIVLLFKRIIRLLPDKLYLSLKFYKVFGRFPNWKKPQTFSEKLQWLKLYDRRPVYTMMVDKYAVKRYIADILGEEYIIPTLGIWDTPEDIEWEKLPSQFVLKTTHGGGNMGVIICRDKNTFDIKKAIIKLKENLKIDLFDIWREWPYKDVAKRIIAEKYLEPCSESGDLPDYKLFCFNGEPRFCQVISGRESKMCIDFFDKEWTHQPFHEPRNYPFADVLPEKPKNLDKMWRLAAMISKGYPFLRIDFYEVKNDIYLGEITLYPTSGMGGFAPEMYDKVFGQMLDLNGIGPKINR